MGVNTIPLDATTFLSFSILAFLYCINHEKKTLRPEYTNIAPAYDKETRCMASIGCFRMHWNGEFVFAKSQTLSPMDVR